MKTVLILSPHFPPSTLAGVHRARHLAKHLPAHGWRPTVVRVDEKHYTEASDPALADLVPANVKQVQVGAIPARLARVAGVGDVGLRSYFAFQRALARQVKVARPDILLITGAPFYPMLLSGWARNHLRIPVVLDFQDPWVSAQGATHALGSKAWLAHRLARGLEPRALRHADFITSVSDRQNDEMAARYPWLDRARMAAIPIGGDPDDFDALRVNPPANPQVCLDPARINLSYVGTFLPRAGALVQALFQAVRLLREESPELAGRLALHFVGTSNQPNGHDNFRIRPIAEVFGIGDLVHETPQRVPYLEALSILANSHGLLLIGSDEPHYTASKIYPALMSGRPYLSLFHAASSAHSILSAAGGGRALAFNVAEALDSMAPQLTRALAELTTGGPFSAVDTSACLAYLARHVAGSFAAVFNEVVGSAVERR